MRELREEAIADGRAEGREEGRIKILIELVRDGDISIEKAAQKANLTVEEFTAKITATNETGC